MECEGKHREKRENSSKKDDIIAPFRNEIYQLRQRVLLGDDVSLYVNDTYLKTAQDILHFENLMNEHYKIVADICKKMRKYFPNRRCCDFPFVADSNMFTITISMGENIDFDRFKSEFVRQVILQVLDDNWKKFIQYLAEQVECEGLFLVTDKYLKIKQEMENVIFEWLMNAKIPLNLIPDNSIGNTQTSYRVKMATIKQQIATCPCGSGKPFAECHGQRKYEKRR